MPSQPASGLPYWPLAVTIAVQTLATMVAFTVPAAAPEIARDLAVPGALVGFFISTVYGVGIVSAVLSPAFIHRYGAVRVCQLVALAAVAMLAAASAGGSMATLALAAVLLGLGYGATAPSSTHLLVPRTPPKVMNLVLSIRQIGVPLGGVLAGLVVPPLVLWIGWRGALAAQLVPAVALLVLLELPRRHWDAGRDPRRRLLHGAALQPFRLARESVALRRLAASCFIFSGVQLCFIAFMSVHLTSAAGLSLILAGQALAVYQVAGVISRPIWGWLADTFMPAARLLVLQGVVMAGAAAVTGRFGADWAYPLILVVAAIAGATASGFTGIAYAEFARLGGERRTEATGLGSGAMFAGVMLLPSGFGIAVALLGSYEAAYTAIAVLALAAAVALWRTPAA